MKRCIICGNVGSDDSTVCEVCGNPYVDIRESDFSTEEDEQMDDADVVYEEDAAAVEDTYEMTDETQEKDDAVSVEQETEAVDEVADLSVDMPEENDAEAEEDCDLPEMSEPEDEKNLTYEPQQETEKPSVPLRGEPHIYGQTDADRSGRQRMTSGAIRREMGRAYEGSRADAPARGAARPADIRRPAEMSERTQRSVRPEGRNAAARTQMEETANVPKRQTEEGNGRRPVQAGAVNGSRPVQAGIPNGGRAAQTGKPNGGRPVQAGMPNGRRPVPESQMEYARGAAGGTNGVQAAPNHGQASVRPVNVQGGPVNMQNRPAGAYVNAARPVNYAAQRMAMTARGALKSPLLILVALLQTAYLVGSVMAVFLQQVDFSQVSRLLANVNFPGQIAGYMNSVLGILSKMGSGAVVANLVPHIPELLLCIGLWMTVIAARTKKDKMSGTGLILWKIYVIIGMIGMCIALLAGLVIGVALVVSAWAAGSKTAIAVSVIILILLIVVTMLVVMYYFSYLATLKTFRKNANGEVYGTASGYVAVIHVIGGLCGIINLLSGIVNEEIGTTIGAVGQIGWMVLFGLWIFQYRTKMSGEEE